MRILRVSTAAVFCCAAAAQNVPLEVSPGIGPEIVVASDDASVTVNWKDEAQREWAAVFRRDPAKAPIAAVRVNGRDVLRDARPFYRAETGKRRKGWNAFFDYPPAHPEGTQAWQGRLALKSIRVEGVGNRVRVVCRGFRLGIFSGDIVYTFFPASRLIRQEAVLSTSVPDTAYYYDAGLAFAAPEHGRPGRNMNTRFAYYDTAGELQSLVANGLQPERVPYKVRYRALATAAASGSVAAFPAPHQYFFPRDFTSNLGQSWHRAWRGDVALGIRQIRDTDWRFYPWMNAPPGSLQRMGMFLLLSGEAPEAALEDALRYTNRDRFPALAGYKTLAAHWHLAYTVQALEKGWDWTPPFKTVLQEMGVDAAIIMDFHGDGHPRDLTELRLQELDKLDSFFKACRAQSDERFLLIPSEEANVHLGGTGRWCSPSRSIGGWTGRKAESSSPSTRNTERFTAPKTPPSSCKWFGARTDGCTRRMPARRGRRVPGRDSRDRAFSGPALFRRGMEGDTVGTRLLPARRAGFSSCSTICATGVSTSGYWARWTCSNSTARMSFTRI